MKKPTQKQLILDYIDRFGSITPIQAFADLGITRLAARVSDLKEAGVDVRTEMVSARNIFGKQIKYAKYSIGEKDNV